jgi:positive phototaxis protein PixI
LNLVGDIPSLQSSPLIESRLPTHQQFLTFQLLPSLPTASSKTQLWSMEIDDTSQQRSQRVSELVNVPIDRVVPMPHLPPAVMGIYNWRGEILWIVDLAILLGLAISPRRYRSLQPMIILTGTGTNSANGAEAPETQQQQTIGLVVDRINEIEWCERELIPADTSAIDSALSSWVRGLSVSATGEKFLVLDWQAAIDRASFHADV